MKKPTKVLTYIEYQKVYGPKNTEPLSTMIAQNADKRYVHLTFTNGHRCCLDRTEWTEEVLYKYLRSVLPVINHIRFSEKDTKVYQEPTYSRIPGGLNARQVDLDYINSEPKFREAILKPTTTFFDQYNGVFACTLADKIKFVTWMKAEHNKFNGMTIFWPGKYQSHAFYVLRRRGAMTKILDLLIAANQPSESAVRMEALRQIRKMRAELNGLENKVNESLATNPYWEDKAERYYS